MRFCKSFFETRRGKTQFSAKKNPHKNASTSQYNCLFSNYYLALSNKSSPFNATNNKNRHSF